MAKETLSGKVAVVGIGETTYYKRAQAPVSEFQMCTEAIKAAADDAGIDVRDIDGFSSYSDDRNDSVRVAHTMNMHKMSWTTMHWGGGGGGCMGAIANAAAGIAGGFCDYAIVYRALAQGQFGRFGQGAAIPAAPGEHGAMMPYGMMSPAQMFTFKIRRFMHDHGVDQTALRAIALSSYHHAQQNPRAVMYGKPLSEEKYDNSRYITEPLHLFDCCQENDGAAALLLTSVERAKDLKQKPAVILGAGTGAPNRQGNALGGASFQSAEDLGTACFKTVADDLWTMSGLNPSDIDVLQSYENFTGGVLMAMVEHGFCKHEDINKFFELDNFKAENSILPLNTSGGNLAECYMHGLELGTEAVKQIRGTSFNQVKDVKHSMVIGGPMVVPCSNVVFGQL